MAKIFVLDTNVLLHNPQALFAFDDNEVVIPLAAIEEIDSQKRRQDEIGRNARTVSRQLDGMRSNGQLSEKITLPKGGTLRIEVNHQDTIPKGLDPKKCDNRILAVANSLQSQNGNQVTLVTKDLNLRIKADVIGIKADDFRDDKVDYCELFTGFRKINVPWNIIELFFQEESVPLEWDSDFGKKPFPNEFMVLCNSKKEERYALARFHDDLLYGLNHKDSVNWGIRARNNEQRFAVELLLDDSINVVTLVGKAGTGKTLLALAVGMEKVIEQDAYKRLLVTRPVVPMGDDLGYLPGSKEEKLRPWMQPIYDNLEYILRTCPQPYDVLTDMLRRGTLEMEALTYIRGRSIPNQFIICDEAQNLSPNMVKALITRVGEGTKIVFTGDPEQIDHPYLDASSNGLTYLVEKLKNEEIAGHVTLIKGERSKVAELGAKLL